MKVKFSTSSQDIDVFLTQQEFDNLIKQRNPEYLDNPWTNPMRGVIKELDAYIFIAYSEDRSRFISNEDTPNFKYIDSRPEITKEQGMEIMSPAHPGNPYYINLRDKAIQWIKRERSLRIRKPGGSKLGIIVEEELL
jgi:hypothetical protein